MNAIKQFFKGKGSSKGKRICHHPECNARSSQTSVGQVTSGDKDLERVTNGLDSLTIDPSSSTSARHLDISSGQGLQLNINVSSAPSAGAPATIPTASPVQFPSIILPGSEQGRTYKPSFAVFYTLDALGVEPSQFFQNLAVPQVQSTPQQSSTLPPDVENESPKVADKIQEKAKESPTAPPKATQENHSVSDGKLQCSGSTLKGGRCTRQVTIPLNNAFFGVDDESDAPLPEAFCRQHQSVITGSSGFYTQKDSGVFVKYPDWIPDYLQPETQAALRVEMEKAPSEKDKDGYIYTFEILDAEETDRVFLKVGRTVTLAKRIDEWGKQCKSREHVLRGWWPGEVNKEDHSNMKGRIKAGRKGRYSHRLERLIHLELGDLSHFAPYLKSAGGEVRGEDESTGDRMPGKGRKRQSNDDFSPTPSPGGRRPSTRAANPFQYRCPDCGKLHKEIFPFRRFDGSNRGKEWELIVKPVIEKWGMFVEAYY